MMYRSSTPRAASRLHWRMSSQLTSVGESSSTGPCSSGVARYLVGPAGGQPHVGALGAHRRRTFAEGEGFHAGGDLGADIDIAGLGGGVAPHTCDHPSRRQAGRPVSRPRSPPRSVRGRCPSGPAGGRASVASTRRRTGPVATPRRVDRGPACAGGCPAGPGPRTPPAAPTYGPAPGRRRRARGRRPRPTGPPDGPARPARRVPSGRPARRPSSQPEARAGCYARRRRRLRWRTTGPEGSSRRRPSTGRGRRPAGPGRRRRPSGRADRIAGPAVCPDRCHRRTRTRRPKPHGSSGADHHRIGTGRSPRRRGDGRRLPTGPPQGVGLVEELVRSMERSRHRW